MSKIKLLDCTLRDGGYINNWEFGSKAIYDIKNGLEKSNADIIELGFLKNEPYSTERTVFNSIDHVKKIIGKKKKGVKYAVMSEVVNPLPLDMIDEYDAESADIIRVIIWKTKHNENGIEVDALQEGYEYCKGIVEKGYKLCVQPARVDQYTDDEFISMIKQFSLIQPYAIYVVDSWGTQTPEQIIHYTDIADEYLPKDIKIGYHGHNNMMQTLSASKAIIDKNYQRDIILDASIYGIGRGAGNLNYELIAIYLNNKLDNEKYDIEPTIHLYESYLKSIYQREKWGYSVKYLLTALYNCNPLYAKYYEEYGEVEVQKALQKLGPKEKVIFSKKAANEVIN